VQVSIFKQEFIDAVLSYLYAEVEDKGIDPRDLYNQIASGSLDLLTLVLSHNMIDGYSMMSYDSIVHVMSYANAISPCNYEYLFTRYFKFFLEKSIDYRSNPPIFDSPKLFLRFLYFFPPIEEDLPDFKSEFQDIVNISVPPEEWWKLTSFFHIMKNIDECYPDGNLNCFYKREKLYRMSDNSSGKPLVSNHKLKFCMPWREEFFRFEEKEEKEKLLTELKQESPQQRDINFQTFKKNEIRRLLKKMNRVIDHIWDLESLKDNIFREITVVEKQSSKKIDQYFLSGGAMQPSVSEVTTVSSVCA